MAMCHITPLYVPWRSPLIALVVIMSCLTALLLAALLWSRCVESSCINCQRRALALMDIQALRVIDVAAHSSRRAVHATLLASLLPAPVLRRLEQEMGGEGFDARHDSSSHGALMDQVISLLSQLLEGSTPPATKVAPLLLRLRHTTNLFVPQDLVDQLQRAGGQNVSWGCKRWLGRCSSCYEMDCLCIALWMEQCTGCKLHDVSPHVAGRGGSSAD
jgi:hypothetical protein